jgi:transcriptional regulator with XRE-family HTH domain
MYPNLKLELWKSGIRQNRLAKVVGIHETLLSKIVNGFREPDAKVRNRIAAVLKSDEDWLFLREGTLPLLPEKPGPVKSLPARPGRGTARLALPRG